MRHGQVALAVVDNERLDVGDIVRGARRRVAVVSDRCIAAQLILQEALIAEHLRDQPGSPVEVEAKALLVTDELAGNDPRGFLSAMLKRVQAVVGLHGGKRVAVDPEDPAVAAGLPFRLSENSHICNVRKKGRWDKMCRAERCSPSSCRSKKGENLRSLPLEATSTDRLVEPPSQASSVHRSQICR